MTGGVCGDTVICIDAVEWTQHTSLWGTGAESEGGGELETVRKSITQVQR